MDTSTAALVGAALATCGWLYTARRARTLSRKQHTVTVMLQASLNKEFRDALLVISDAMKNGACPDLEADENKELRFSMRFVTNHYEFVAAGLRNGDFDERLVRDSERGVIVKWTRAAGPFLAMAEVETRLLVCLSITQPRAVSAVVPVGMWSTCLRCPHVHRRAAPRRRARQPWGRGSRAPDAGGARCRMRSNRRCRPWLRDHRRSL